jgi:hypothetical protein
VQLQLDDGQDFGLSWLRCWPTTAQARSSRVLVSLRRLSGHHRQSLRQALVRRLEHRRDEPQA